jgi:hypothetical protein
MTILFERVACMIMAKKVRLYQCLDVVDSNRKNQKIFSLLIYGISFDRRRVCTTYRYNHQAS